MHFTYTGKVIISHYYYDLLKKLTLCLIENLTYKKLQAKQQSDLRVKLLYTHKVRYDCCLNIRPVPH